MKQYSLLVRFFRIVFLIVLFYFGAIKGDTIEFITGATFGLGLYVCLIFIFKKFFCVHHCGREVASG